MNRRGGSKTRNFVKFLGERIIRRMSEILGTVVADWGRKGGEAVEWNGMEFRSIEFINRTLVD